MAIPVESSPCLSLKVVIVGGGIAGLSAAYCLGRHGHNITVIEDAPWLEDAGAGIQLSPNASKLLLRWGLGPTLEKLSVKPKSASFHRYDSDERIGFMQLGVRMETERGAPHYHVHRADLVSMLYKLGKPYTTFQQEKVIDVIPTASSLSQSPSVVLSSGEVITADIIIGADGVKSTVRECVFGSTEMASLATGDVAYRAVIPVSMINNDDNLRSLVEIPEITCWMGPGRHIVGYFVRSKELFNLAMVVPDDYPDQSVTPMATSEEIESAFQGWNQRVIKLARLANGAKKFRLVERAPAKRWVDRTGRIILLGDSCHAMLPYLAQGAAMAIEDAAVIGSLLSGISDLSQIAERMRGYEEIRIPRVTATHMASRANQVRFHLTDGPQQLERDRIMKEAMKTTLSDLSPSGNDKFSDNKSVVVGHDKNAAAQQFNYDAEAEADNWLQING